MSFRQKIILSHLSIFIIFVVILYPIATRMMERNKIQGLRQRVENVISKIKKEPSEIAIERKLDSLRKTLFFEVTLVSLPNDVIYSSYPSIDSPLDDPEILQAAKKSYGYSARFVSDFEQEMAFVALPFLFNGKQYVLRGAFPYGQTQDLIYSLTLSFLWMGLVALSLFTLVSWLTIHYFTAPARIILDKIRPYQMGLSEHIPRIEIENSRGQRDEFTQLAHTLNSLTERIQKHITHLTEEKNDKVAILDSLVEGIVAVDENLKVGYMNRIASQFLNVPEEKLVGKSFKLAQQPDCEQLVERAQELGVPVTTVLKPTKKQKKFFDVIAVPRMGQTQGALLVIQDKTGLHKVIELGKDFIANASHELKTPITIIRGFAETLHDHPELSTEMYLQITEKIVSNCDRMNTLVKNLLTLAAIDEGLPSSRLSMCDIPDLVGQARQFVLSVHKDAKISIEIEGKAPFQLYLDSDLFFQALINLMENAAKYSMPPAHITVKIKKNLKTLTISISDKGIGMAREELERIFERFYAVDKSHSRSLGGSGLGLSIVERIVDKHRGKIQVESTKGKGSTFTIILPLEPK